MTAVERRSFISQYFGESVFEQLKVKTYDFGDLESITEVLNSEFEFQADKFLDKISRFYVFEIPLMKAATRVPELLSEKRSNNLDLH